MPLRLRRCARRRKLLAYSKKHLELGLWNRVLDPRPSGLRIQTRVVTFSLHRRAQHRRLLAYPQQRLDVLQLGLRHRGLYPRPSPPKLSQTSPETRFPFSQRTMHLQRMHML
jgi:hypothetical protein